MVEDVFDSTEAVADFKDLMQDPAARQAFLKLRAEQDEGGARMRYSHILRAVGDTPWAIRPAVLGIIIDILAFRAAGGRLDQEELAERIGSARRQLAGDSPPGVAVIPIHGAIVPKAGMMTEVSGATSVEAVRSAFRQAMADRTVGSVIFDIDSPGGMVDQVPEMASEIRNSRGRKPITAVANAEAASAAYWLASQADRMVVTKSSRIGSIGVFTAHEDESAREANRGVKTTLVSAGKYKTEGNPFEPLTEEGKAHMQTMVNEYYDMFVRDVASGRGVSVDAVRNGYGEGRVVGAREALRLGMADSIGSLEGAIHSALVNSESIVEGTMVSIDHSGWLAQITEEDYPGQELPVPDEGEQVPGPGEGDTDAEADPNGDTAADDEMLSIEAELEALKD